MLPYYCIFRKWKSNILYTAIWNNYTLCQYFPWSGVIMRYFLILLVGYHLCHILLILFPENTWLYVVFKRPYSSHAVMGLLFRDCKQLLNLLIWLTHPVPRGKPCPIKSSLVPRCHCITAPELSWWRHQTETFFVLLALCAGNSPAPMNSPKKANDAELWCFLWSAPQQTVVKQSRLRWFETPSSSLWRHCYAWRCSSRIIALKIVLAWCCSITCCKS